MTRNIVYSYADSTLSDELEIDLTDELSFKIGDILTRNGRVWKVASLHLDTAKVPTLWVLLENPAVN